MMFLAYLILSLIVGVMGVKTRIGFWGFFFLSLIITPILGFAIVIIGGRRDIPKYTVREHVVKVKLDE